MPRVKSEVHRNKRTLYSAIIAVLNKHCLYDVTIEKKGYTLRYWFPRASFYKVIKGQDEKGFEFKFFPYEIDDYQEIMYLKKGDILMHEGEFMGNNWFICTTRLKRLKALELYLGEGYTDYCSLKRMVKEGLIEKVVVK